MNKNLLFDPAPADGNGNPPATPATPAGDAITRQQFHDAIEKARLEERTKLRGEIDAANTKATETHNELTRIKGELEILQRAASTNGQVDVPKIIAEVTQKAEERFAAGYAQREAQLSQQVQTLSKDLNDTKLERLRNKLVAEVGGESKVIMGLIRGNNEAEIRESVKSAHQEYLNIENRIKPAGAQGSAATPSNTNGQANGSPAPVAPPVIDPQGQGGAGAGTDGTMLTKVRELSSADYKANRDRLKGDLARRYPSSRS